MLPPLTPKCTYRSQLKLLAMNCTALLVIGMCLSLFWPFIPHFLCDFIFYFVIWQSVIIKLIKPLWKFCNLQVTYRRDVRIQYR